ncbi:MAG: hypothetical protein ACE5HX_09500, partial [bacterium]
RYLHKDGLIMRHDKKAFAREVIKAAAMDKIIGDYLRILLFSYYVRALPWPFDNIKNAIAPFTGCFVSKIPLTVVYLRFALKMSSFFIQNEKKTNLQVVEFLQFGTKRLHETIQKLLAESNSLHQQFIKEKQGWNLFYDTLDTAEMKLQKNDVFTLELQKRALSLVKTCNLSFS